MHASQLQLHSLGGSTVCLHPTASMGDVSLCRVISYFAIFDITAKFFWSLLFSESITSRTSTVRSGSWITSTQSRFWIEISSIF